ncbi:MAG: SphA family protein [Planctomycetota bacterium]|jgi:hypothetical protein
MARIAWTTFALLLLFTPLASAQETNRYPLGSEGLRAGSLPPPGLYVKTYAQYYGAGLIKDSEGDSLPGDFDLDVWAVAPRIIYITPWKILGGTYGFDVLIPIVSSSIDFEIAQLDESEFGLADIFIEPISLGWRKERWDWGVAYGVFAPTGDNDPRNPASLGKGYWSHLFTAGATWYIDKEKTWTASILARYEIHSDKDDVDLRPGDDFMFEWGVGKRIGKAVEVGVVGYAVWQVTEDSGDDARPDMTRDRVFALGPEFNLAIPTKDKKGLQAHLALRLLWEFEARDRPQGFTGTFVFLWVF